ncbi:MAG: hypothetical protein RLO23_01785 [Alphaproteobacteria bacterium]
MRRPVFRNLGNAFALFAFLALVLSGMARTSLPASFSAEKPVSGLAAALQTICSSSGLRHEGGEAPSAPHAPGSIACSLCCLMGPVSFALASVPPAIVPFFAARTFRLSPPDRQADAFLATLPPSRAPPSRLIA